MQDACNINLENGLAHQESPIAQWLERPAGIWEAMGSIPVFVPHSRQLVILYLSCINYFIGLFGVFSENKFFVVAARHYFVSHYKHLELSLINLTNYSNVSLSSHCHSFQVTGDNTFVVDLSAAQKLAIFSVYLHM